MATDFRDWNRRRFQEFRHALNCLQDGIGLPSDSLRHLVDVAIAFWNRTGVSDPRLQNATDHDLACALERWVVQKFVQHEHRRPKEKWTLPTFSDFAKDRGAVSLLEWGPIGENETLLPDSAAWDKPSVTVRTAARMIQRTDRWVRELIRKRKLKVSGHGQRRRVLTSSIRDYLEGET